MTVDQRTVPSESHATAPALTGGADEGSDDGIELTVGSVVDRYVVVARLGSGSGGVVYSAFDSHLGRRIALKVLSLPDDPNKSPGWRRLVHEAQLVARLDHPHVVTVHDVGLSDGVAFIAMELVDGSDLAQWLAQPEQEDASWRKRIAPLLLAGKGLAAAHERQVVHGDFKPANVLLGRDHKIRVTDFGVSRLHENCPDSSQDDTRTQDTTAKGLTVGLDDWSTIDDARTRPGRLWGTPLYMAPELFDGARPTIASDVYSFAASVYEALYRQLPARGRSLMSLYASKLEPATPPTRLRIPRRVRDVVIRALSPEPAERPRSVTELIDVIERAMRPRRRSWSWVAGSVVIASAFAAVGAHAWQQQAACSHAQQHLEGVWDPQARRELQAAVLRVDAPFAGETWERVDATLDAWTDDWVDTHTQTCLATQHGTQSAALLDAKMACLDARRAELAALVGVLSEGDPEVLKAATAAALELRSPSECRNERALPSDDTGPTRVDPATQALSTELARARSLASAGRLDESDALAGEVLARARRGGHVRLQAEALHRLGENAAERPGAEQASDLLQQAIWVAETHKIDDVAASAGVDLLWVLAGKLTEPKEALQWAPHVEVAVKRAGLGPSEQALLHHARATALTDLGRDDEAFAELAHMDDLIEQLDDPRALRSTHAATLGTLHHERGELEQALSRNQEALRLREELHGPHHPITASTLHNVANVLAALRRFDESLALQRRALAVLHATNGSDHPDTITAEADLAAAYAELDRLEEAAATYRSASRALANVHGEDHLHYGAMLLNLAGVQGRLGQYEEAEANAERALKIVQANVGEEHPWFAFGLINRGTALNHLERHAEAEVLLEHAMDILGRRSVDPQQLALGRFALAKSLLGSDPSRADRRRALQLAEQALATWEEVGAGEYAEDVRTWLAEVRSR